MITHLCFDVLNGNDYWLPLTLNPANRVNTLIFDAVAPGGDIRVTFSPINTKSTYQTDIPAYNLVIGGCCNSSSYIRRINNSNATKVVESSAFECLAEKGRCTYWFSFDSQTGWISFGKGTDTSLPKALLKWHDPSPLLNLKYVGLSNYNYKINFYNIQMTTTADITSPSGMIAHLCFDVLNGSDYWLPLTLNPANRVNTLIFDAVAPGGDIRVTFSPINTKSTYQTDIPTYNLAIGGYCNSSSYIRRINNSNATKVVESSAVECLAEKGRCTYWFSFDSQTGWVSFGKGADTSLSKALLKWQDPSPLLNLKYVGLSNYNYKIDYYNIRIVSTAPAPPSPPRRLLPLFIDAENLVKATFPNISALSPSQLSQVRLLAAWLKASNTQKQLDLCSGNVEQPETVVSVFNALLESFGIKTGVTENSNDDSYLKQRYLGGLEYAGQTMRLSFPTLSVFALESQDELSTSATEIEFNLIGNTKLIPIGSSQRQIFIECFEQDVASAIGIHPNAVLVKNIRSDTGTLMVVVVITTDPVSQKSGSDSLDALIQQLSNKDSQIFGGIVSRSIASYNKTSIKTVPIFQYFELSPSDFNTRYNKDYTGLQLAPIKTKGNRAYYPPIEWYRHGLNISKYGDDSSWIGSVNSATEWPVVFHGTSGSAVKPIATGGLKTGSADAYGTEARQMNPKVSNYNNGGVYCSPDISVREDDGYAKQVTIPIRNNGTSTFKVAFMCRVDPTLVTQHYTKSGKYAKNCPVYWRVMHESGIRPYGLLLKKIS